MADAFSAGSSVTLAWNPHPDPTVRGYKVRYGTASGSYTQTLDAGNVTQAFISNLSGSIDYYFVVSAYNSAGLESPPTGEIKTDHDDASLFSLALSVGTLTTVPSASGAGTYSTSVPNSIASITVTPTPTDGAAKITVNGLNVPFGAASQPIPLGVGTNAITVGITARDGFTRNTYTILVTRLTVPESWRQKYFGTTANAGAAADSAIPQGDGVPNLMKFATAMDPTKSGTMPGTAYMDGGLVNFSYIRSKAALDAGLSFRIEWCDRLNPPNWSSKDVMESAIDLGNTELVTATVLADSPSHVFVRLSVTGS